MIALSYQILCHAFWFVSYHRHNFTPGKQTKLGGLWSSWVLKDSFEGIADYCSCGLIYFYTTEE